MSKLKNGKKEKYFLDATNICYWKDTSAPTLSVLLQLVISIMEVPGNTCLCIFDANTHYKLPENEKDIYRKILNMRDIFYQVTGGKRADGFVLELANEYHSPVVSNDNYNDPAYEKYKWKERTHVPQRLFMGEVIPVWNNFHLIMPELGIHTVLNDSTEALFKKLNNIVTPSKKHRGRVKFFKKEENWGRISYESDIYFHRRGFRSSTEGLEEGLDVEFIITENDKGLCAERLILLPAKDEKAKITGTITEYSDEKGRGRIQVDDKNESLYFYKNYWEELPKSVEIGMRVQFVYGKNKHGACAKKVRVLLESKKYRQLQKTAEQLDRKNQKTQDMLARLELALKTKEDTILELKRQLGIVVDNLPEPVESSNQNAAKNEARVETLQKDKDSGRGQNNKKQEDGETLAESDTVIKQLDRSERHNKQKSPHRQKSNNKQQEKQERRQSGKNRNNKQRKGEQTEGAKQKQQMLTKPSSQKQKGRQEDVAKERAKKQKDIVTEISTQEPIPAPPVVQAEKETELPTNKPEMGVETSSSEQPKRTPTLREQSKNWTIISVTKPSEQEAPATEEGQTEEPIETNLEDKQDDNLLVAETEITTHSTDELPTTETTTTDEQDSPEMESPQKDKIEEKTVEDEIEETNIADSALVETEEIEESKVLNIDEPTIETISVVEVEEQIIDTIDTLVPIDTKLEEDIVNLTEAIVDQTEEDGETSIVETVKEPANETTLPKAKPANDADLEDGKKKKSKKWIIVGSEDLPPIVGEDSPTYTKKEETSEVVENTGLATEEEVKTSEASIAVEMPIETNLVSIVDAEKTDEEATTEEENNKLIVLSDVESTSVIEEPVELEESLTIEEKDLVLLSENTDNQEIIEKKDKALVVIEKSPEPTVEIINDIQSESEVEPKESTPESPAIDGVGEERKQKSRKNKPKKETRNRRSKSSSKFPPLNTPEERADWWQKQDTQWQKAFNVILNNGEITDLPKDADIQKLGRISRLSFARKSKNRLSFKLTNLSSIGIMKRLIQLNVSGQNLQSLEGIEQLPKLTILRCNYSQLKDLRGVQKLKSLKELYCQGNQLTASSFRSIHKLTELRKLDAQKNKLTDTQKERLQQLNIEEIIV